MDIRKTQFAQFAHCYECVIENRKLIICADVGPRILSLSVGGGNNILFVDKKNEYSFRDFKTYGGSRFWLSPETLDTYDPDNNRCTVREENGSITVVQTSDVKSVEKSVTISEKNGNFSVTCRVSNRGSFPLYGALWSITCIVPTGTIFFPWGSASQAWNLKKIIYWQKWMDHSSNVESGQYVHGNDLFLVRLTGEEGKVGTSGHEGFIGVTTDRYTFIKKFNRLPAAKYPDDDCAIECYTCKGFAELETLSPLYEILPGESAVHEEEWIVSGITVDVNNGNEVRELL